MTFSIERLAWILGVEHAYRIIAERLNRLYIGDKIALCSLLAITLMGAIAALNRFVACEFSLPKPRSAVKTPRRKKGFGLKHLVFLLLAILPGGIVGTLSIYAVLGKEHWRREALHIVGFSLIPGLFLLLLHASFFPWPDLRDEVFISGALGLIFALLQIWALLKLLREWWGEPEECVGWWPPLALTCQILLLAGIAVNLFGPLS